MQKSHKIALIVIILVTLGAVAFYFSRQNNNKEQFSSLVYREQQVSTGTTLPAAQQSAPVESSDIRLKVLESSQQLGRPVKLPATTTQVAASSTTAGLAEQTQTQTGRQQEQVRSSIGGSGAEVERESSIEVRTLSQTAPIQQNSINFSSPPTSPEITSTAAVIISTGNTNPIDGGLLSSTVAQNTQENEISHETNSPKLSTTTQQVTSTTTVLQQSTEGSPSTPETLSSLSTSSSTTTQKELEPSDTWKAFTLNYARSYPNREEELKRREIFLENERFVTAHNSQSNRTFSLALNQFADLTRDEINQMFVGPQTEWQATLNQLQVPVPEPIHIIAESPIINEQQTEESSVSSVLAVDWRNITAGEPIDQGLCRESSVYTAVASIEAAMNSAQMSSGFTTPFKLSERQVLDCMALAVPAGSPPFCQGHSSMLQVFDMLQHMTPGVMISPIEYQEALERSNGQVTDICSIPFDWRTGHAKLASFNLIHRDNIPDALLNSGPLAVALDASQSTFHFYKDGLYHDDNCSTETYNHHALLVGYYSGDKTNSSPQSSAYYTLRNTFGSKWGESGYMRLLKHDTNKCLPQNLAISPNLKLTKEVNDNLSQVL